MIDLKFGGAQLTQESYVAYYDALGEAWASLKQDAETFTEGMLTDLKVRINVAELQLESDPDNPAYIQALDKAKDDYQKFLDSNPIDTYLSVKGVGIQEQAYAGWELIFGDFFDQVSPKLSQGFSDMLTNAFNPENVDAETLDNMRRSGSDLLNYIYNADQIKENFSSYLSEMLENAMGNEN